jgi:hypothetical protein
VPASKKLPGLRRRRSKLTAPEAAGAVFSVAPAFVMPYMTGYTEAVEKALFLRRFGVPFWGLTYVFGRTAPYWERLELRLDHNRFVGTWECYHAATATLFLTKINELNELLGYLRKLGRRLGQADE